LKVDKYHIDILTANFVLHPDWFDVVVASNLFGDIPSPQPGYPSKAW
jgi:tartrate dehydrogenase/decarboxylase/D-malate dehydrogenase